MKNIIDTAIGNPKFSTLVSALKATDLVSVLSGPGPFTVLAPTNDAFSKIKEEDLKTVLGDKEKLTSILKYHVLSGKVMAKDITTLKDAETLNGKKVKIDATHGVMVNTSKVTTPDIVASNGVIHAIDTVLMP